MEQALAQTTGSGLTGIESLTAEELAELRGLAKPEHNTQGESGPPVLKINYDEESVFGTGVWVLGQKKGDGDMVTEHGQKVDRIIILTTRLQYSYYNKDNPQESFSTQMYEWGGKAPDKAQFDAKLAAIGKADDGRFRVVVFSLAVLADGWEKSDFSFRRST